MRQIIFKAKRLDNGEWVEGDLLNGKDNHVFIREQNTSIAFTKLHEVAPSTVCQYTGLKDRKGQNIYEGDTLECVGNRIDNRGKVYHRTVVFEHGQFCLVDDELHYVSAMSSHIVDGKLNWEVVGNIHDKEA